MPNAVLTYSDVKYYILMWRESAMLSWGGAEERYYMPPVHRKERGIEFAFLYSSCKTPGLAGLCLAHVAFTFPGLSGLASLLKSRAHPKFLHVGLLFSEKCPPSHVILLRPLSFGFLLEIYKIFKTSKSYTSNECLVWYLIIYNTTGKPYLLSGHISSILP